MTLILNKHFIIQNNLIKMFIIISCKDSDNLIYDNLVNTLESLYNDQSLYKVILEKQTYNSLISSIVKCQHLK